MLKYLFRRLANYFVMIFVATSLAYLAAVTVMKPETALLQRTPRPTMEQVTAQLQEAGLDPTLNPFQRYLVWLKNVVFHFDWGMGPDGSSINQEFLTRAVISGRLVLLATLLSIVIGIALGVFAASRQYSFSDRSVTTLSYVISCIPAPVIYLTVQTAGIDLNDAVGKRLLYVSGMYSVPQPEGAMERVVDIAQHLVLPTVALTIVAYVSYQLLQRSLLLDNINADYVRMARAKGLTKSQAVRKHALRTSFIPVAQSIAFQIPGIFTGTFIIEAVFAWEGLGRYTLDAITSTQNVNAAVAGVAFGGVMFAIGAICADLSVAIVDPRARVA
ncbi:ABC transporter permease [Dermatophilus congolensis]|uniref:ABC transporter permease n=1 Tax=Dermatophilus congolensis TaxID=1863 RepID=UPI0004106C07|nr:ABC transporter permease [Dermatophilus congolensis]MBO3128987.1 ABC transporter permease [Dermatophilus congolensis]MBO3132376.1 ABC transporter permease [Dermatophilus congolensis]MBO3133463.1 ABC transporter permease [Dermatophilus congolensis]MBO3135697.1 ABC transporter permease [Dermatophilus congolensis]MBO3137936.1 ABC transporter permease [Dermatophilus congolensis]